MITHNHNCIIITITTQPPYNHQQKRYILDRIPPPTAPGFGCRHGAAECAANAHQLCARDALAAAGGGGTADAYRLLQYLDCRFERPAARPDLAAAVCMDIAGFSPAARAAAARCAADGGGWDKLRESGRRAAAFGATRSCTVAVEGRFRCLRDMGGWRACSGGSEGADFARSLCDAYRAKTGREPPAGVCAAAAPPPSGSGGRGRGRGAAA